MTVKPWFSNEELNFLKFSSIIFDEFPRALRQTFISMWNSKVGGLPGYKLWDDSVVVRNMLLASEGGKTDIPINKSIQDWECTALFKATIFAKTFRLTSSTGAKKTLAEFYLKGRKPKPSPFHPIVNSPSGNQDETLTLAIDQLRLLRNTFFHAATSRITKADFDQYVQLANDAFIAANVPSIASSNIPGSSSSRNWKKTSIVHREKFEKLIEIMNSEPGRVTVIKGVSVCFEDEFCIGNGCLKTKVYIGLCQDGMEKAVKRLPSQLCESLGSNESSILTSKDVDESPRIVSYWLYDTSNPQFFYLILNLYEKNLKKYVDEQNLEDLKKNAPKMMRQILEGLETLHSRYPRILHRDLKPSNILVNVEEDLLLADFGISKMLADDETTCLSEERGTNDWKAVDSIASDENVAVKYKRQSDIQVAGMLAFYILTKGEYVYGPRNDRRYNLSHNNPVYLENLKDPVAKDLIAWMLKHEICDRPYAEEALKHPYLQSLEQQSEMICSVGNEPEITNGDVTSEVVQRINAHPLLKNIKWKSQLPSRLLQYASRRRPYDDPWTECLRFIRNRIQHSNEHPPDIQQIVGEARVYFMKVFPLLPVVVYQTIRCYPDWKTRPELKKFFA